MRKIIKTNNTTGINEIDIDLAVKNWDNRFSIIVYVEDGGVRKYTFNINRKNTNHTIIKSQISNKQALELVGKLNLVWIDHPIYRRGSSYISKEFAKHEFERLSKIYEEKLQELNWLNQIKNSYNVN